jgi:hypothetical protein
MHLSWNRNEDGSITVYATDSGKTAELADLWQRPMREDLGIGRAKAAAIQQSFAEWLCTTWNDKQVASSRNREGCWLNESGCSGNCGNYGCGG